MWALLMCWVLLGALAAALTYPDHTSLVVRLHSHSHGQVGFFSLYLRASIFHFTHGRMRVQPHCFTLANIPVFVSGNLNPHPHKEDSLNKDSRSLIKRLVKETHQRRQILCVGPCKLRIHPHSVAQHSLLIHPYNMGPRDHSWPLKTLWSQATRLFLWWLTFFTWILRRFWYFFVCPLWLWMA